MVDSAAELKKKILHLHDTLGLTPSEVGRRTNKTTAEVRALLLQYGKEPRGKRVAQSNRTQTKNEQKRKRYQGDALKAKVLEMHGNKVTPAMIGIYVGRSSVEVRELLKIYGVEVPKLDASARSKKGAETVRAEKEEVAAEVLRAAAEEPVIPKAKDPEPSTEGKILRNGIYVVPKDPKSLDAHEKIQAIRFIVEKQAGECMDVLSLSAAGFESVERDLSLWIAECGALLPFKRNEYLRALLSRWTGVAPMRDVAVVG